MPSFELSYGCGVFVPQNIRPERSDIFNIEELSISDVVAYYAHDSETDNPDPTDQAEATAQRFLDRRSSRFGSVGLARNYGGGKSKSGNRTTEFSPSRS
jgi:hypothetical protein